MAGVSQLLIHGGLQQLQQVIEHLAALMAYGGPLIGEY